MLLCEVVQFHMHTLTKRTVVMSGEPPIGHVLACRLVLGGPSVSLRGPYVMYRAHLPML
jgi:hypothetical protein